MPSTTIGPLRSPRAPEKTLHAATRRPAPSVWAAVCAALLLFGLAAAPAAQAADRSFAPRFATNDTGDIDIFGNTLMTCPSAASGCAAAQQSGVTTTADQTSQNNAYNMQYIDVDGDASTFNSSRSTVTLPAGSTVLFAGLYWGARVTGGTGGQDARSAAARGTVKFRAPGAAGYTSLNASTLDDGDGGIYQGFVDVTSRVAAAGSGAYTVADVQAGTGTDRLAGWSLVIAYRDTAQPARNLSVFDGIKSINGSSGGTINITGFTTPPAGEVRTRVGFVAYEGDGGIVGDSASLNGTVLSDPQHPASNFFNSRSSRDGVRRTATDPNYPNQLGVEQSILQANGILANSATSARIDLTTSGDVYAPGVVTFATELYAPKIEQTKTVVDVNGGAVEQGDVLRYTITGRNTGQDGARNFVLRDPIPANSTYRPGTLVLTQPGGTAAAASDGSGDDLGEYSAGANQVVARFGTGATPTAGGVIAAGAAYTARFDVIVGGPSPALADNSLVRNFATASFNSVSLNTPLTAESAAEVRVRTPDLVIEKSGAATADRGGTYDYSVVVRNTGPVKSQGPVTVTDSIPAGLVPSAASGDGWSCVIGGATFTCTRDDSVAAGQAFPTITLRTTVANDAPDSVTNTASVAGGGDPTTDNNGSTFTTAIPVPVPTIAGLSIAKSASTAQATGGSTVTYTLTASNSGPAVARDVVIEDPLPAGVTFASADAPCTFAAGRVTCAIGDLAVGADRALAVRVTVDPLAAPGGTFDATATHQLEVTKVEAHLGIQRDQTQDATATCPAGYFATDGSVRIDAIDQGSGSLADVQILSSRATADGRGWTATVRNTTTGQAQTKVNVVCTSERTSVADGHSHPLVVSDPVTATGGAGDTVLQCPADSIAVAPSFTSGAPFGTVRGSQREGNGWRFTVDGSGSITFSIRCLSTTTGVTNGHVHGLALTQLNDTVSVPAGQTVEKQLTCADDAKGIVASTDIDPGLVSRGNDPQPKTRVFKFTNPTGGTLTARVGLLCLGGRTTGESAPGASRTITNTASVRTSSDDATTADDRASATFVASGSGAARSTAAPKASILSSSLRVRGTSKRATLAISVRCAKACSATGKLVTKAKVRGTKIKKGAQVAIGSRKLKAGKKTTIVLVAKGRSAKALRQGRMTRAKLIVRTSKNTAVMRTVRLRKR